MTATIRITAVDGEAGNRSQIIYVDPEGKEIDISRVTQGADVSIRMGEPNRVTLHCLYAMGSFEAELENIVLNIIPPDRIPDVIRELMKKVPQPVESA